MLLDDLGEFAPLPTDTGHHLTQSFRPLVWVWGKTESKGAWDLGLKCIAELAFALYKAPRSTLFHIGCADHAASGRASFMGMFPHAIWLSCWIHVLRRVLDKKSLMPPEWGWKRKNEEAEWFQSEVKKLFSCPSHELCMARWEMTKTEVETRGMPRIAQVGGCLLVIDYWLLAM